MTGKGRHCFIRRPAKAGSASGTVFIESAAKPEDDLEILWVRNRQGVYVGFLFHMRAAPTRDAALARAALVARRMGMDILAGDDSFSELQASTSSMELLGYADFARRFGTRPCAGGMFADEGGTVDRYWEVFACKEGIESPEAVAEHARQSKMAAPAAAITILVYAAVVAATYLMASCAADSPGQVLANMAAVWATVLVIAGAWMLLALAIRLARWVYDALALARGARK